MLPLILHGFLRKIFRLSEALTGLIYPPVCHLCRERLENPRDIVCQRCWHSLPLASPVSILPSRLHFANSDIRNLVSVWMYAESVPKIIHLLKYNGFTRLARPVGVKLGENLMEQDWFDEIDGLIPVPLHRGRERERGYNQSLLICHGIRERTGLPIVSDVLKRVKFTRTQTRLSPGERHKNVSDAFGIKASEKIHDRNFVLVDDVLTTGATLNACTDELHRFGARKIWGATACRVST